MDTLPLSLLNDYLYCPRRAALKLVEGWRGANEHTVRGDIVHQHADLPGYEVAKGTLVWRGLPVWSDLLGLSGKCDIVEAELRSNLKPGPSNLKSGDIAALRPIEYKKGKRRQFANDDAQLCAQALCLEEMFSLVIERGAVFHAESKRRREVAFTPELRALVERAVAGLRELIYGPENSDRNCDWSAGIPARTQDMHPIVAADQPLPAAVFKPACEECSLFEICLPRVTSAPNRAERLSRALYEI
jgi:CRISPR-associated exonuclease Cas4